MGHIPREISRHCYVFLKEGGNITGHLICTNYKVSPIPAGGLGIPLLLTFSVKCERIFELMKSFVNDTISILIQLHWSAGKKQRRREE